MASPEEALEEYGLALQPLDALRDLDALILAVAHDAYKDLSLTDIAGWFRPGANLVLIDVKGLYDREAVTAAGFATWRL
jgi:UDP-N-acetyl-D-galactosamine dehydrogenase